jgi:hypothetical protein
VSEDYADPEPPDGPEIGPWLFIAIFATVGGFMLWLRW